MPPNALVSVLLNYELYGSGISLDDSFVKLLLIGCIFIASNRLEEVFGLTVLPNDPWYFSPDGDLGGVSPF